MKWRRRADRDAEIARDIEFHLQAETEENIARGMSPEDARADARRKFGNLLQVREQVYRMPLLEILWRDVLYALRTLRKNPAFAATAIMTLALGIGGNTAIFSVVRAVLLKPLEYRDPDRLVYFSLRGSREGVPESSFTTVRLDEMRAAAKSFTAIGAFLSSTENFTLSGVGDPETLKASRVSANFLNILGVQPIVGRGFLPGEEHHGGPPVAMISASLWQRRFAAAPDIAGKTITLDAIPHTVIGVLPAGFKFPYAVDVWVTRPSEWSILPPRYWGITVLLGFARLQPGVTLDQARAEMDVLNRQYLRAHPNPAEADKKIRLLPLRDRLVSNVRPMLWMLFGAVGFVLLIACANVASLLLARGASRAREFEIRTAIGGTPTRLIAQLLAESLVLAGAGGALGVIFAIWGLHAIERLSIFAPAAAYNPLTVPGTSEIHLDGTVLLFTLTLTVFAGVLFGLWPSLQATRKRQPNPRGVLVAVQVAMSVVLLIGAGLLLRSFARARSVDSGFQPQGLLTAKIALPPARYDTDQKKSAFFAQAAGQLETIPGVRRAAVAMSLPTTTIIRTNIVGPNVPENSFGIVQAVTPGYFRTLGIPLRRGREFTEHDNTRDATPVLMINESLARKLWPDGDALGRRIGEGYDKALGLMEIVGVVADIHGMGLTADAAPEFYISTVFHPPQTAYIAVRTDGDPRQFVKAVRARIRDIDRDQAISEVKTMEEVFDSALGQRQQTAILLGSFAGVALLLAIIGIYGVVAYSVAQRTKEVGIRRALGAQRADILRLVVGKGFLLTCAGLGIGIAGALGLSRLIDGFLFQVSATDPLTFGAIAILFVAVALLASLIPALRATKIDPMESLRL